jgi:hypothetical protein
MNVDFSTKKGNVVFNDFPLKEDIPIIDQLDDLKEDMIQVEFPGGYILDIGWKPSFNINGKFYIYLIKDYDWESPIYKSSAKNIANLKEKINKAMNKF